MSYLRVRNKLMAARVFNMTFEIELDYILQSIESEDHSPYILFKAIHSHLNDLDKFIDKLEERHPNLPP